MNHSSKIGLRACVRVCVRASVRACVCAKGGSTSGSNWAWSSSLALSLTNFTCTVGDIRCYSAMGPAELPHMNCYVTASAPHKTWVMLIRHALSVSTSAIAMMRWRGVLQRWFWYLTSGLGVLACLLLFVNVKGCVISWGPKISAVPGHIEDGS